MLIFPAGQGSVGIQLLPFQPQAVADDADAAEGHCRSGYHRIEQEAVDRIEDAGCYRHANHIVDECPEEILPDGADSQAGKPQCLRDLAQVRGYYGHPRHIHCNVASASHCNAEIRLGKGCAVVDPITCHGDFPAFLLQIADEAGLVLWQDTGLEVPYAGLCRHGCCRRLIVTGEHVYLDPFILKSMDGPDGAFLYPVGDSSQSQGILFVREPDHCPCLSRKFVSLQ